MNLTYLLDVFKKNKILYLLISVLYIIFFIFVCCFINEKNKYMLLTVVYFPTTIFLLSAYIIPIYNYYIYYNKNKIKVILSFPEKRHVIFRTQNYFHIFINIFLFLFTIFIGVLILLIKGLHFSYFNFLYYAIFMSIIYYAIYSVSLYICSISHTILDAIILNLAYIILPFILIFLLGLSRFNLNTSLLWNDFSFIGQADRTIVTFMERAILDKYDKINRFTPFIIDVVCGFIFYKLVNHNIKKFKYELIGTKTKSILGYKLIIPLYLIMLLTITFFQSGVTFAVMLIFIVLCYIIFSLFSQRSIKITKSIIIKFITCVITSTILYFILR